MLGDSSSLERAFKNASRDARVFNAQITGTFRGFSRGLGFAAAAGGVATLGLAIRDTTQAAIDFESSFAGVRKTVDATEPQLQVLAEGFRAMAREIPITVDEINRIGESAGQLGIARGAILDFTRTVAELGTTTNLASDQAADALARIANITGLPADQFENLGSTLVDLGNKLAATESEIIDFGLRIAGAGQQVGLTEAQILAIAGAFASVGVESERGGTAVSKVLLNMNSAILGGGKNLEAFAKVAGQSASQFEKSFRKDAGQAFLDFVKGLERIRAEGGNTFAVLKNLGLADARLIASFQAMASGNETLSKALRVGTQAFKENNALTKEAEKRYQTSASRLQVFKNRLNDLQITLGGALVPALEDAIRPLSIWLQDTRNQERAQKELSAALSDARSVIQGMADVVVPMSEAVRDAAGAVGGLREATKLLLAVMVAARVVNFTTAILGLGTAAGGTAGKVRGLRASLLRLGAIGVIALGVEVVLNKERIHKSVTDFLRRNRLGFLAGPEIELPVGIGPSQLQKVRDQVAKLKGDNDLMVVAMDKVLAKWREWGNVVAGAQSRLTDIKDKLAGLAPSNQASRAVEDAASGGGSGGGGGGKPRKFGIPADTRNRIFDAELDRRLDRVQDLGSLKAQLGALGGISAVIQQQIAKVKDVTRKLTLRDRLMEVSRQAAALREEIAAAFIDSLQLGLERAGLTKTLNDDLAALNKLEAGVQAQIAVAGKTNDLERQLLDIARERANIAEQQREQRERAAEAAREARDRKQFRTLGLAADGSEVVPGVNRLKKQLGSIGAAVEGTFLDTGKTASLLKNIRKVLSAGVDGVSRDVRSKIADLLADLDRQLKEHGEGPQTKAKLLDVSKELGGLGLTGAQLREATSRLAGASGHAPGIAGAAAAGGASFNLQTDVYLDGDVVARAVTRKQERRRQRSAPGRRGVQAG